MSHPKQNSLDTQLSHTVIDPMVFQQSVLNAHSYITRYECHTPNIGHRTTSWGYMTVVVAQIGISRCQAEDSARRAVGGTSKFSFGVISRVFVSHLKTLEAPRQSPFLNLSSPTEAACTAVLTLKPAGDRAVRILSCHL